MKIDSALLDTLSAHAKANPRLRQAYDLRTHSTGSGQAMPEDNSQRMLNALEPGTIMPIHRHRNTSETMVMVRGALIERFYNEDGTLVQEFEMRVGGECSVVQIEAGQWHSLEVLESGTILPIHRHRGSTETVVVLRGKIRQNFYDEAGLLVESIIVAPRADVMGFSVEVGRWHNTECLESGTVILECKDGRYCWN